MILMTQLSSPSPSPLGGEGCSDWSRREQTLVINALGPLVIEVGGIGLRKVPKKARALLVYLAMREGAPVTREKLADLLWPYQQSEQGRHSLRNCLTSLRKALGFAAVHLVTDFIECRLSGAVTDFVPFEQLARSDQTGDLTAAAELYRGELIDGLYIASEPFEEWLAGERERALRCVREVLGELVIRHLDGDFHAAIAAGRRLVDLDPLCERGHRAMMRAYAAAGQRGDAIRQYRSSAEILARELGVSVDPETKELAAELFGGAAVIIRPPKATPLQTAIVLPAAEPTRYDDPALAKPGNGQPETSDELRRISDKFTLALDGKAKVSPELVRAAISAMIDAATALGSRNKSPPPLAAPSKKTPY